MRGTRLAASAAILVLCAYFAIINHVDVAPWNNLERAGPQLRSTLTGIVPLLAGLLGLLLKIRWLVALVTVWIVVWFAAQMHQWWLPYLLDPTPLHSDVSWYAENGYADTLSVLPQAAGRPTPDAQHLTLQGLSLIVLGLLARTTLASRRD